MSKLRVLRVDRKMFQKELAKKANMKPCEISLIERGFQATPKQLAKLQKALGLTKD